jgi:hypothetical protein
MNDFVEKAKGYKLIGIMAAFIVLTLLNGTAVMPSDGLIGDLTAGDLEKALLAAAMIAGKAFLNRTFGKGDGVEVVVKP